MRTLLFLSCVAWCVTTAGCVASPDDDAIADGDESGDGKSDSGRDPNDAIRTPYGNAAVGTTIKANTVEERGRLRLAFFSDPDRIIATADVVGHYGVLTVPAYVNDGAQLAVQFIDTAGNRRGTHSVVFWPHPEDTIFADRLNISIDRTQADPLVAFGVTGISHAYRELELVNDGTLGAIPNSYGHAPLGTYDDYYWARTYAVPLSKLPAPGTVLRFQTVTGSSTDVAITKTCITVDTAAVTLTSVPCT